MSLTDSLRAQIRDHGPLTCAAFMDRALYDPEHGYYGRGRAPGRGGDFFTAADLGPGLAQLLATQLADLVGPAAGRLIELGPGSGRLLARLLAVLAAEAPDLLARLEVVAVEPATGLVAVQQSTLASWRERVRWASLAELAADPRPTLIVGNEVIDALPAHRLVLRGERLRELGVGLGPGDELTWVELDPAPPLAAAVAAWDPPVPAECVFEVRPAAADLLRDLAAAVPVGALLLFDYGDARQELFGPARPDGTLRAYREHALVDPLAAPGEQDLTTSVDFTSLAEQATAAGFEVRAVQPLPTAALALGAPERIAALAGCPDRAAVSARLSLLSLMSPGGFGASFQVLVAGRGEVGEIRAGLTPAPRLH